MLVLMMARKETRMKYNVYNVGDRVRVLVSAYAGFEGLEGTIVDRRISITYLDDKYAFGDIYDVRLDRDDGLWPLYTSELELVA